MYFQHACQGIQNWTPASSPIIIHEYVSSDSFVLSRDLSPPVSGTEPIVFVPASQDYPPITVTVPTMDQDVLNESYRATNISRASPTTVQSVQLQFSQSNYSLASPTTVQPVQLQVRANSPDASMNRNTLEIYKN